LERLERDRSRDSKSSEKDNILSKSIGLIHNFSSDAFKNAKQGVTAIGEGITSFLS
jgi:hypothetical protein